MTNLKDYLHKLVYVPAKDGKLAVCLYVGEMQWWKPIIEVEETEKSYVLNAEELKTLLGEAFDAGRNDNDRFLQSKMDVPNKEQYVSLLLK